MNFARRMRRFWRGFRINTDKMNRKKRAARENGGTLFWDLKNPPSCGIIDNKSGCGAAGSAGGLGVPWRYPGQGKVKRRKALQRLRLLDFPRLQKTAQKRF